MIASMRFIPLSAHAPRTAVRELLRDSNVSRVSWQLIAVYCVCSALIAAVADWRTAQTSNEDTVLSMFGVQVTPTSLLLLVVATIVINPLLFLLAKFLWAELFLFMAFGKEIWAGLAIAAAFGLLLETVVEILSFFINKTDPYNLEYWLLASYLVIAFAYGATIFSEALSISRMRSFLSLFAITLILFTPLFVSLFIVAGVVNPDFWGEIEPPVQAWNTHEQV